MIALLCFVMASAVYSVTPAPGNHFTLEVDKTGLMKGKTHTFSFSNYSGKLAYDSQDPTNSKVEFTLEGTSMTNEDSWVKESDRKKILAWGLDKMIEVTRYPTIQFMSGKIARTETNHFNVAGKLTMRGVTRPAVLAVTVAETAEGLNLAGTTTIDMRAWGMEPPSTALGAVGTKPEMRFQFQLKLPIAR